MIEITRKRPFVIAEIRWLTDERITAVTVGTTCYRERIGESDLFSVFLRFDASSLIDGRWARAKVFALVEDMEERLPLLGEAIVITAGLTPIARGEVIELGEEARIKE